MNRWRPHRNFPPTHTIFSGLSPNERRVSSTRATSTSNSAVFSLYCTSSNAEPIRTLSCPVPTHGQWVTHPARTNQRAHSLAGTRAVGRRTHWSWRLAAAKTAVEPCTYPGRDSLAGAHVLHTGRQWQRSYFSTSSKARRARGRTNSCTHAPATTVTTPAPTGPTPTHGASGTGTCAKKGACRSRGRCFDPNTFCLQNHTVTV